jgi:hypothetical protein
LIAFLLVDAHTGRAEGRALHAPAEFEPPIRVQHRLGQGSK